MSTVTQQRRVSSLPAERIALLSGVVFTGLTIAAIIFFISNLGPHMAPLEASLEEHVGLYQNYGQLVLINNYMWVLPVPFFMFFLGGLFSLLRRAEGDSAVFSTVALVAGAAMMVPWVTNTAVESLAVNIVAYGGDLGTVWALDGLGPTGTMGLAGLLRAVFLIAVSMVLLRQQLAPRWIGWFGYGLTVLCVIGSLAFIVGSLFPLAWLSIPLIAIWVLCLTIALLRQGLPVQHRVLEQATV